MKPGSSRLKLYPGVHKRRETKEKRRTKQRWRDELHGFSSRETSPPGNILGFSIHGAASGLDSNDGKKKKRPADSELNVEDSWANGNPLIARVLSLWQTFALSM